MEVKLLKMASTPIFHTIYRCPNYLDFKKELLHKIKITPSYQETDNDSISRLDYNIDKKDKTYLDLITSTVIIPTIDHQAELFSTRSAKAVLSVPDIWFQQYKKYDIHKWHTHSGANFNNIFYVEKPKEVNTEFYCPIMKTVYIIDNIQEGDVLSFPGHVIHRSGLNTSDDIKTVVVFNSVIHITHKD